MPHEAHRDFVVPARFVLPVVLALVVIGCGGGTSPSPATTAPSAAAPTNASAASGAVTAGLSEFKIELGATSAPAGSVTFDVTNNGTTDHEFVVFKTDLPADDLPISADGNTVDEEGDGVTAVDEIAEFGPETTKSLTVDLPAGHYVLICNVPTHYTSGMRAEFTTD